MATKLNPGPFDCYRSALPDEPMFILLGRDASAPDRIRDWVAAKRRDLLSGRNPDLVQSAGEAEIVEEDLRKCSNAEMIAHDMQVWRARNNGQWRLTPGLRRKRAPIDPALREIIEQETYRVVCSSLMAGTQQVVLISHDVRDWTAPGFNCREHEFRFDSVNGEIGAAHEGREINFEDWHVAGFDSVIGDVRVWTEGRNILHVRLQVMGD